MFFVYQAIDYWVSMDWSPQQLEALDRVRDWLRDPLAPQVFRLFGFAGTGKTTLAKHLASEVRRTCFAAYTGKAALVMRKHGCENAMTLHRLIYRPEGEEEIGRRWVPTFTVCPHSPARRADLIVIDECSMVDEELAADLLSFKKKVLVLGDPGQLPPVNGNAGFFTNAEPDYMLTEVHRQAWDNPILALATKARLGERIELGSYGDSCVIKDADGVDLGASDQLLVGMNRTRRLLNKELRRRKGRTGEYPVIGDELICLRNNHKLEILNGEQFKCTRDAVKSRGNSVTLMLEREPKQDEYPPLTVSAYTFPFLGQELPYMPYRERARHQEFDFSYALTVHKGQGSQWDHVTVYDEWGGAERNRWLYTAITRAAKRVTIVEP